MTSEEINESLIGELLSKPKEERDQTLRYYLIDVHLGLMRYFLLEFCKYVLDYMESH